MVIPGQPANVAHPRNTEALEFIKEDTSTARLPLSVLVFLSASLLELTC